MSIQEKRDEITREMIKYYEESFISFTSFDKFHIKKLFELYNKIFFDNGIDQLLQDAHSKVDFQTTAGNEKSHVAGFCRKTKNGVECTFLLSFPIELYTNFFKKGEKSVRSGGIDCHNRLQCLQVTFEHELVHLLVNLFEIVYPEEALKKPKDFSAHGKLFKCIVYKYFGQTDVRHQYHLGDSSKILKKEDFKVGDKVVVKSNGKTGTVVKMLVKNVLVKTHDDGKTWRMPPVFLEKSSDANQNLPPPVIQNIYKPSQNFNVGDRVFVKGNKMYGTITKKLLKNFEVVTDDGKAWRVSPDGLEKSDKPQTTQLKINTKDDFEIGDKVIVKGKGWKGTVDKILIKNISVKMDDGKTYGVNPIALEKIN